MTENFEILEKFDFYVVYRQDGKDWMFDKWFQAPGLAEEYITDQIHEKCPNLFAYTMVKEPMERSVSMYDRKNELVARYRIIVYHART